MIKIKFNELPVKNIDGTIIKEQWAENIGNIFFRLADNVAEHDLAVKIYHEAEGGTELSDKEVNILKQKAKALKYFLQIAINEAIGQQTKAQEEMIG